MGAVGAGRDPGKADVAKEGPCKGWFFFLPEASPTGTPQLHALPNSSASLNPLRGVRTSAPPTMAGESPP